MKTLTQKQLEKKLEIWQRRLRLQHWTIRVILAPKWTTGSGTTFGQCWPEPRNKQAEIKILRPEDFDQEKVVVEYDAEATLVHELLHIVYAGGEPNWGKPPVRSRRYDKYESATEHMAVALVNMHRKPVRRGK